jgi:ribosomal protein L37E
MSTNRNGAGTTPKPKRDDGLDCEICGARMYERSCKIMCRNCGYTRDCSDP